MFIVCIAYTISRLTKGNDLCGGYPTYFLICRGAEVSVTLSDKDTIKTHPWLCITCLDTVITVITVVIIFSIANISTLIKCSSIITGELHRIGQSLWPRILDNITLMESSTLLCNQSC